MIKIKKAKETSQDCNSTWQRSFSCLLSIVSIERFIVRAMQVQRFNVMMSNKHDLIKRTFLLRLIIRKIYDRWRRCKKLYEIKMMRSMENLWLKNFHFYSIIKMLERRSFSNLIWNALKYFKFLKTVAWQTRSKWKGNSLMNDLNHQDPVKRCQFVFCLNNNSRISLQSGFFSPVNLCLSTPHQCFYFFALVLFFLLDFNPLSTRDFFIFFYLRQTWMFHRHLFKIISNEKLELFMRIFLIFFFREEKDFPPEKSARFHLLALRVWEAEDTCRDGKQEGSFGGTWTMQT